MNRRRFLGAILAAGMAPAIVKASSLMPVFSRSGLGELLLPELSAIGVAYTGLLTPSQITREALRLLENNLVFLSRLDKGFDHSFAGQNAFIVRNLSLMVKPWVA